MSVLSLFITLAVATAQAPAVEGDAWLAFRTAEPDSMNIDHTRHGLTSKLNDNFSQLMFIDFKRDADFRQTPKRWRGAGKEA